MTGFSEEVGDVTEEVSEVSETLEKDIEAALGVSFDVSLQNLNENHRQGTQVVFRFEPDPEEFTDALNEVSDGAYEDVDFQNAGGVHLHIVVPDDE